MAILGLEAALANTGATFVVGSTTDAVDARPGDGLCSSLSGACTLRAAIQEANALPGADLIEVPAGTYALTIPPLNDNGIETGDLDITGSVTISGAGADVTVVDGGLPVPGASPEVRGLDRLFEVAVDGGTVAFDELTIRDGYATEHGGAIASNSTATVTVADSVLTGNVAKKSGGAIDNHFGGTVKVRDSIVSGNLAFENGSALNNNRDGMLEVVSTEITSNSATPVGLDETLFGAGAISNNAELDTRGTIVVTDSEIAGNRAGGGRSGATIANDGTGTVTVERSAFSGNHATGNGGAIFNDSGYVEIVASIFSENSAADGGALYNAARQGSMSVRGSSFSFNTASGRGGAIVTEGTGALAVHASSFTGNSADDWGGAIVNDDKGSATIADSTFRENSGLNGGAFANEGSGLVKLENSTFADNSAVAALTLAGGEGGGVHSNSVGEVVITGGAFTGNEAVGGGGLSNEGGGTLTVTGTLFSANRAEEWGGAILIESGDVRMDDIDVVGNTAGSLLEGGGGGISYAGDKVIATGESAAIGGSRIRDNSAIGPGGGIDSRGDGPLDVLTTSITGNEAAIGGAIHHVGDAPLDVSRSTLAGNDADDGGGMFTDGDGETTVENSTVSGNAAGQFGGGLLVSSRLVLRSSTVARNTAAFGGGINNGGGDAVGDGSVLLANTIVADNPTGGNCAGTMTSLGGNVESADSCALRELSDQPGTNPLLGALADNGGPTRTHALLAGSPAQDKAVCTDALPCPPVDQRNVARPLFAGFDAGAYESQTAPGGGGQPCAGLIQRPIRADFDSWISQSSPASNFGSDATLKVESKPGANDRALVHFALPPRPPGCKLVGATLRLFSSSATDGHELQALRVASPWSEGVVTWTNQPATAGDAATIQSGAGTREWNVLTQVGDMYAHGAHGFLIRDADENGSGEQSFHSHEKGEDPPELVLVFADPDAPPPHGDCPTNPQSVAANMDSWVSQSSPLNFFGSDSTLKVKSQLANNARALVRFPLPALPPGCSGVASATLKMAASSDTEGRTLQALQVASAWTESSVTWSSQPATTGPAATALTGPESLEWNVKDQLRAMYASANHGFLVRDAVEDDLGFEQTLNSRDKLNDGPPELVIVFEEGGPVTTIDSGPSGLINDPTPTFSFSSSDSGASFQCRVGSGEFTACTSPHTTAALPDGVHVFELRAVGAAGTTGPVASRTINVDTTAPQTSIGGGPDGLTADSTPTFSFSSPDAGAGFQCRVGSGEFTACTSPHTTAALPDGVHVFEVRAFDAAGNLDATPATRTITVDTIAPQTMLGGPGGLTGDSTPTFTFSSPDAGASFRCRLGGGEFTACTSPHTTTALADGMWTFEVRAVDAAGNRDASPATATWTIDTTAPVAAIDPDPTSPTRDTTPTFTFSSEPGARFECRVGSAEFAACDSPHTVGPFADGTHTFEVRATDAAGNTGPVAGHAVTVDTTAPETTIESGPDPLTGDSTPTFEFSSEPGARFECRVGSLEFAACSSPHSVGRLDDGAHTFEVRAIDAAGNVGAPADHAWTIDSTVPDSTTPSTELADEPPALTRSADATFSFSGVDDRTAAELIRFECRLDSQDFTSCDSPKLYAALPDGEHRFEVRAVDAAANRDPSPEIATWTIDTTAPDTAITAGPAEGETVAATTVTFAFTAEQGASFDCALDGPVFEACTSPREYTGLTPGPHAFSVRATDGAGNVDGLPAQRAWHVGSPVGVPLDTGGGGIGGSPPPPEASKPQPIRAKLSYAAKVRKRRTTLRSLRLTGVPAGALVRVTCVGRSCPRKSLRIASPAGGVVRLKPFQDERLRPGTTLTVRVSKTGMTDAVLVLKVRAGKPPRVT